MKRIFLALGVCLFLFGGLITGCDGQDANSQEVNDIVSQVMETNASVDTCRFEMSILQNLRLEKTADYDDIPDSMTLTGEGEGMLDAVNREMQMKLSTNVEMAGEAVESMLLETYVVDGYMYSMFPNQEGDIEWVKMTAPTDMWDKQNQLAQQAEMLETADSIEYLGEENVDGVDCYVVEINPSEEAINKLLSQIDMPVSANQLNVNFSNIFEDLVIKQWVAKDSKLFIKTEEKAAIELEPKDIGMSGNEFQKMMIDVDIVMKFYDYNKPLSVELPAEALEATEIPE